MRKKWNEFESKIFADINIEEHLFYKDWENTRHEHRWYLLPKEDYFLFQIRHGNKSNVFSDPIDNVGFIMDDLQGNELEKIEIYKNIIRLKEQETNHSI